MYSKKEAIKQVKKVYKKVKSYTSDNKFIDATLNFALERNKDMDFTKEVLKEVFPNQTKYINLYFLK